MAMSGYIQQAAGWAYLRLEWTATHDVANNQSTITSKMYWGGTYAINSTASKDGSNYIDGTWYNFSGVTAGISAGQKKLINTSTRTLSHDSNGNLNVTFDGWFAPEVTLSDVWYGTVSLAAQSWDLDNIPQGKMSVHDGSAWRKGQAYIYDGSAWRKAQNVHVYDGSAWRKST
jgi:hypothetical protein